MSFGSGGGSPDPIVPQADPNAARLAREAAAREAQALRKRKGAMSMIATSPQGIPDAAPAKATVLGG